MDRTTTGRHVHLTGPPANDTLLPSTVLRETYAKLAQRDGATPQDKAWFHTLGAALIRRILEEHAKDATAAGVYLALDGELIKPLDFATFNEALQRLGLTHPRESSVVEMKIFGGMNARDIAEVLAVPQDTVKRDWSFGKASIKRDLTRESLPS